MKWLAISVPLLAAMALNVPARAATYSSVTGDNIVQARPAVYYPDDQPVSAEPVAVSVGASVRVFPGGGPYYYALPTPPRVYAAQPPVYYYYDYPYSYAYPYPYGYTYPYYSYTYPSYGSGLYFNWYGTRPYYWYGGHHRDRDDLYKHHGWYGGFRWYGGHGWKGGHVWHGRAFGGFGHDGFRSGFHGGFHGFHGGGHGGHHR